MVRLWNAALRQPFGVKLGGLWNAHPKFTNRTVLVENNDVDGAFTLLNKLMDKEGLMKIIRNTQYYIKPCQQRKQLSIEASQAIVREDLNRKMKFLMRKNRVDAYPGQITA
ncbi:unnamed protein product [Bursaphelenchus xylophilus]|uniref:(pine wood nematode) hypothetical protein n=1 Tax=Bursaphelenchus xylophilus TaxID=6326 RepID=A0A1I7SWC0_BURXY|nr:unnamed protein product [Bursaphelenchus xylophilus]CAG9099166.1 unnamed protein product [Bursaphelenchus xylophilus]